MTRQKNIPQWSKNLQVLAADDPRTTSDIAWDAGITHTHLKRILSGEIVNSGVLTVASVARVLGASLSYVTYADTPVRAAARRSLTAELRLSTTTGGGDDDTRKTIGAKLR